MNKKREAYDSQTLHRVLILGNGFDLAVGRRTIYKDFYDSKYCPKDYPAPLIKYLNERLGKELDKVRWLDLENALQEFAKEPSKDDYYSKDEEKIVKYYRTYSDFPQGEPQFWGDMVQNMLKEGKLQPSPSGGDPIFPYSDDYFKYTREQRDEIALKMIEKGLADYLDEVGERAHVQEAYVLGLLRNFLEDDNASVYSFNYTKVGSLITADTLKIREYDAKVQYMHGSLQDGHVIIGAKDGDYGDYDFVQKAFDSQFNPPRLLKNLMEADEVIIYGHSLGDCDSQYFEPYFKYLVTNFDNKDRKITIYTYDDASEIQLKKNLNRLTGNNLRSLYNNAFQIIKTCDSANCGR